MQFSCCIHDKDISLVLQQSHISPYFWRLMIACSGSYTPRPRQTVKDTILCWGGPCWLQRLPLSDERLCGNPTTTINFETLEMEGYGCFRCGHLLLSATRWRVGKFASEMCSTIQHKCGPLGFDPTQDDLLICDRQHPYHDTVYVWISKLFSSQGRLWQGQCEVGTQLTQVFCHLQPCPLYISRAYFALWYWQGCHHLQPGRPRFESHKRQKWDRQRLRQQWHGEDHISHGSKMVPYGWEGQLPFIMVDQIFLGVAYKDGHASYITLNALKVSMSPVFRATFMRALRRMPYRFQYINIRSPLLIFEIRCDALSKSYEYRSQVRTAQSLQRSKTYP